MELFSPFSSCSGKLSRPADTLLFVMNDLEMKGTNTKQITETFHTSSSNPCSETLGRTLLLCSTNNHEGRISPYIFLLEALKILLSSDKSIAWIYEVSCFFFKQQNQYRYIATKT